MRRDLVTALLGLAGVALAAIALIDWLGYSVFIAALGLP